MALFSRLRTHLNWLSAWLLVAALVWAHSLGLWHRVAHPGVAAPYTLAAVAEVQANPGADDAHGWLAQLFDSHNQGADCLGFDHALLGAALLAASLALAASVHAQRGWVAQLVPASRARWPDFSARAPPRLR